MNIMSRCLLALPIAALLSGCASTFQIEKNDIATYFGRESSAMNAMLCDQGDLKAILADAELSEDQRQDFYTYVCTDQRSYDKVTSLYLFLTPEQKEKFIKAFKKHGYLINAPRCCG